VIHVPPKLSWDSSTTKRVPGHCCVRWYAAPTPEIPAPTISTSKCSTFARSGGALVSVAFIDRVLSELAVGIRGTRECQPGAILARISAREQANRRAAHVLQ